MPIETKRTLKTINSFVVAFAKRLLALTPFELRRKRSFLPGATLSPLKLVLARHLARGGVVTIVQVGACDGLNNDPIQEFLSKGLGQAVLVEPNPFAFARLQKTYAGKVNVSLVQAAVGEKDGEANFYRAKSTLVEDVKIDPHLQIASFNPDHLYKFGMKPGEIGASPFHAAPLPLWSQNLA